MFAAELQFERKKERRHRRKRAARKTNMKNCSENVMNKNIGTTILLSINGTGHFSPGMDSDDAREGFYLVWEEGS